MVCDGWPQLARSRRIAAGPLYEVAELKLLKRISKCDHSGCCIRPAASTSELAKEQMNYGFSQCDILKISDNEIQFVTGKEDYDEGIRCLQEKYQIPLILLTMGKEGSRAYYKGMRVESSGFSVKTIETTGAGDTFMGSVLNYLLEHDFNNLTEKQLEELLKLANAAAAIVTTRKGVIRAIPKKSEIEELLQRNML